MAISRFRSGEDIYAELMPLLLAAGPSYKEWRKTPEAFAPYSDYTRLMWEFAAHTVAMLKAGRQGELAAAFRVLDEYHHAQPEAWLSDGPGCFFERLLALGDQAGLNLRMLEPHFTPRLCEKLDWFIVRPDDDKSPYPVDGFY